jgi:hypothetical protein
MTTNRVFTVEQVASLHAYQHGGQFHPFTCSNRGDGQHGDVGGDTGMLVPTVRGWICRYCDYTQDWAHGAMMDGSLALVVPPLSGSGGNG